MHGAQCKRLTIAFDNKAKELACGSSTAKDSSGAMDKPASAVTS